MNELEKSIAEGILFTDEYQLTMGQLYYRMGLHEKDVLFDHFFRSYPDYGVHKAGYCINAGLEWLVDWIKEARFGEKEIAFLRSQKGITGNRLFADDFLDWLMKNGNFEGITLRAIPEGRVVHPNLPLTTVQGPLVMAQILETPLLNKLNFQTLIATKASRIHESGRGQLMLEFGLRRGQDKGAIAGTRAALIGGADYSSNLGISHVLGYPPKGTHAHSMVQVFMAMGEGELAAFQAYADMYPDDCQLLVDTINTLESGVPNAIKVFENLRQKGHKPIGIRLDSGDLANLSIQAAKMLNEAGFPETKIVLSNQLDELVIWQIITQIQEEAMHYGIEPDSLIKRLVYGVGTQLITSAGDSALDGVYKLVAVNHLGKWAPALKISDSHEKTANPGHKDVWRIYDTSDHAISDLLTLVDEDPRTTETLFLHHPTDHSKFRCLSKNEINRIEPLLVEIIKEGKVTYEFPRIEDMRKIRKDDLQNLYPGVKRLMNPHTYHVSLSKKLWNLKQTLITSVQKQ